MTCAEPLSVCCSLSIFGAFKRASARQKSRQKAKEVASLRLGKYPFRSSVKLYLESRRGIVAESTYQEEERKLAYLGTEIMRMHREGKFSTADPRHFKRAEIQSFLEWMRKKELDPATQEKYITLLSNLLKWSKNRVIQDMKAEGIRFPRVPKKPIRTIHMDDLNRIFDAVEKMPNLRGIYSRGMVALFFATGIRPKELRLAEWQDLDLVRGRFYVRHPKGEGSWATRQWIDLIRPDMNPMLLRYVKEMEQLCGKKGIKPIHLFPNFGDPKKPLSANAFWKYKREIETETGVEFRLKDFRSTLTSLVCSSDPKLLPAMSLQLRHESTETTMRFYADIGDGATRSVLIAAAKATPLNNQKAETPSGRPKCTDPPLLTSGKWDAGYA